MEQLLSSTPCMDIALGGQADKFARTLCIKTRIMIRSISSCADSTSEPVNVSDLTRFTEYLSLSRVALQG